MGMGPGARLRPPRRFAGVFGVLLAASVLRAEIIDRIAITVADRVITASQVDQEVRLTQFQNHEKLAVTPEEKKKAAGRLVEQALIQRDLELSHYPLPPQSDADAPLQALKAEYSGEAEFQHALEEYGITEASFHQFLWRQFTVLRFTDFRFRPAIQIADSDVQALYQQDVAKWREDGVQPIPALDDVRDRLTQALTEQRLDAAVDQWLTETRKQVVIKYHDEALK